MATAISRCRPAAGHVELINKAELRDTAYQARRQGAHTVDGTIDYSYRVTLLVIAVDQHGFTNLSDIQLSYIGMVQNLTSNFGSIQSSLLDMSKSSLVGVNVLPQRLTICT